MKKAFESFSLIRVIETPGNIVSATLIKSNKGDLKI